MEEDYYNEEQDKEYRKFMIGIIAQIIAYSIQSDYKYLEEFVSINSYYKMAYDEVRFNSKEKEKIISSALSILHKNYKLDVIYSDNDSKIVLKENK